MKQQCIRVPRKSTITAPHSSRGNHATSHDQNPTSPNEKTTHVTLNAVAMSSAVVCYAPVASQSCRQSAVTSLVLRGFLC